jgi:hypothetical protein
VDLVERSVHPAVTRQIHVDDEGRTATTPAINAQILSRRSAALRG